MNVFKELRLSNEEVKELAIAEIKRVATEKIGPVGEDEEIEVDYSSYGSSVVTIRTKSETQETEKE